MGLSMPLEKEIEKNFAVVPTLWAQAARSGALEKMIALMDDGLPGVLGVAACNEAENWQYFIAVASNESCPAVWSEYTVPAGMWAVFPGEGAMPEAVQELERRIVTEWLPTSGYEYANGPDIERYLNADPAKAVFEVWIPVTRK